MSPRFLLLALFALPLFACHNTRATPADLVASGEDSSAPRAPRAEPAPAELAALRENFQRVLFDFDRATLGSDARQALQANAAILTRYPQVEVRIEGHTDHYGSDEYNLALGQRRAEAVRNYLVDLGVPARRVTLVSYGREQTLVGPGSPEDEAPNRRAEFTVRAGADVAGSSNGPSIGISVHTDG